MDRIKIKFFAAFREITGQSELDWPVEPGQTPAQVLDGLLIEYPGLSAGSKTALIMVNRRYANRQTPLKAGDEVAFLPPVGGGQA